MSDQEAVCQASRVQLHHFWKGLLSHSWAGLYLTCTRSQKRNGAHGAGVLKSIFHRSVGI